MFDTDDKSSGNLMIMQWVGFMSRNEQEVIFHNFEWTEFVCTFLDRGQYRDPYSAQSAIADCTLCETQKLIQ